VLLALLVRVSDSTARRLGETPNELTTGERFDAYRQRRAAKASA
jgi:hypothetical protein